MNAHLLDSMRELHSRINDGIHVRLLWRKDDDRVVGVDDAKSDSFVLESRRAPWTSSIIRTPTPPGTLRPPASALMGH